jgi:ABC-type uncharacterized transport system involved in gliding motility auxiliary subunit
MRRSTKQHWLLAVLCVGIALALGWFSERYTQRFDVTANQRNSLTAASIAAIQALPGTTEVVAVMGPSPTARQAVTGLVSRYQAHTDNLALRFINPETQPGEARDWNAAPGGELIIRNSGNERRLQSVSERALTGVFRQLSNTGNQRVAFITGHDERSPILTTNDGWGDATQALARIGIDVVEHSLVTNPKITDDYDLVVIADPRRAYFPGEIASINDWLQRGGNLLWLQETDTHAADGNGLQRFADELGVRSLLGQVIDANSQQLVQGAPTFVVLDRFLPHPTTRSLTNPILLPEVQAFEVTPLAGQDTAALLQTPDASWTELGSLQGAVMFDENTDEVAGPLILGVSIERAINNQNQRIIIIGDADFGASAYVGNGANLAFIEGLFLWLGGSAAALEFVTQAAPDASLELNTQQIITLTMAFLVGLPTLLLGMAAMTLWRRRTPTVQAG